VLFLRRMLDELEHDVDTTSQRLKRNMKKVAKLIRDAKGVFNSDLFSNAFA
jgi:hypothetical protein